MDERAGPPGIRVSAKGAIVRDGAILLIAYDDESGPHFNLPGGGLEPGESARAAVRREALEETGAAVEVGRLLLVAEYVPGRAGVWYSPVPELQLVFACALPLGVEPRTPARPDDGQVDVRWVPLAELPGVRLLPAYAGDLLRALAAPDAGDLLHEVA
jgi:8-oxo-dGTP pyrophosphatase MutT (NUDIX family)